MYTIIGFIGFGALFSIMFAVLIILHWNPATIQKSTLVHSHMLQIAGIALMIFEIVLFQPLVSVLFESFSCGTEEDAAYECYSVPHVLLMISAIIVGILLMLILAVSTIFFTDDRPLPVLPWENCCFVLRTSKALRKILISFVIYAGGGQKGIAGGAVVGALGFSVTCLYELFTKIRMRDKKIFYAYVSFESITAWLTITLLLALASNHNLSSPFIIIVLSTGLSFMLVLYNSSHGSRVLLSKSIKTSRTVEEVEEYCRVLLDSVEENKEAQKIAIEGIITAHNLSCKELRCPCHEFSLQYEGLMEESKEEKLKVENMDKTQTKTIQDHVKNLEHVIGKDKQKNLLLKLIIAELTKWNIMQEGKARIHVYIGYLKLNAAENLMAALYEEMCAEEIMTGVYEEYHAFRLRKRVEEQLSWNDSRERTSNEMNNLVIFQRILAETQDNMQDILKLFIGFWKELQNESPNFQYLGNTSHEITEKANKVRADYRTLISINPANIYCRMLYALFLKKVMKDEFEAFDVHEETSQAQNSNKLLSTYNSSDTYGENNKAALFIISGNKSTLGEILCINNEVTETLGYEKNELIGHNVSQIMPPAIGRKHTEMVLKSFDRPSGNSKKTAFMVLPLHKQGYLLACSIIHRVVPELHEGVQIIGFVRKMVDLEEYFPAVEKGYNPEEVMMLLVDDEWLIHAFNIRAARLFGINPVKANLRKYVNSEERVDIRKVVPQFEDEKEFIMMKSNYQADVVLTIEEFRKQIDAEFDTNLKTPIDDELSVVSPNDLMSPYLALDIGCRGVLHYMELQYGKYDSDRPEVSLKLVVILEGQAGEKGAKHIEAEVTAFPTIKQKQYLQFIRNIKNRKENLFFDDATSQSSNSSQSSANLMQRNVRFFKETLKEQKSPFFVRCFLKLGVIILLLILASAILEYVLATTSIRFVRSSFNNAVTFHKRLKYLLNIPQSFRTIYNIYQYIEPVSSESYANRIRSYSEIISEELEALRVLTRDIEAMKHPFSSEHKKLFDSPWIQLVEPPEQPYDYRKISVMNYTLPVAITTYVATGTKLKSFDMKLLREGYKNTSKVVDYALSRLMMYMIDNVKGTMTYYSVKSNSLFYEEVEAEVQNEQKANVIVLVADPLVILALMVIFIPFILKVQSSLRKIYAHLCQFKGSEIKKWLEECNVSMNVIKASIKGIRKIYGEQNFEIIPVEDLSENATQKRASNTRYAAVRDQAETHLRFTSEEVKLNPTRTNQGMTEISEFKKASTEEDEPLMVNEKAVTDRKNKMFSRMTRKKTKAYLVYMLILAVSMGVFKLMDGLLLTSLYSTTDDFMVVMKILSRWEQNNYFSLFFFRETLKNNQVLEFFDYSDATSHFSKKAFESEQEIAKLRSTLTGYLSDLRDFFNIVNSNNLCAKFFQEEANCETAYKGFLTLGFKSTVLNSISYIRKLHEKFLEEFKHNASFSSAELQGEEIVHMNDITNFYVKRIFEGTFNKLIDSMEKWISYNLLVYNIKFAVYIIFLMVIFGCLWKKMVSNMQFDIVKALGILNILPTVHLRTSCDFISDMNRSNLIN